MAYVTKKEQRGYIDFRNLIVDFTVDDVGLLEGVRNFAKLRPTSVGENHIIFCKSGQLSIALSGQKIDIKSGDIIICPPKVDLTSCTFSDDFTSKVIRLSDHIVQALLRDKTNVWHRTVYINQLNVLPAAVVNKEEMGFYCALIKSKLKSAKDGAPNEILMALIRALLLEICIMLENEHGLVKEHKLSQGKVLFNRFLNMLSNSEVKRRPISYYAGQLAITPKYLTMLCQKYSDKTASEWVVQYTTEEIRFYLRGTDLSIKEISARLGFSNMSHFGSYVRKNLGVSPSEYRSNKKEV